MFRIGVDVGGTNTDGVLIDITRISEPTRGVLAHYKAPTTPIVSEGIETAVRQVLEQSRVSPSRISCLSIGTTAFVNAVLEADARRLAKVAVIRLCGPYTRQCPPFIDFPKRLRYLIEGHVGYIDGGLEIDGREITPLKEEQVVQQCAIIKEKGLRNVVLSGIFSPLDTEGKHEATAMRIVQRELGLSVNVVCSRDVGQVGLLERENASILNASILSFAQRTILGFRRAMHALKLSCPLFLTQNDGTLTSASQAARLPIRTFASGPTNSMRGAAFLAGLDEKNSPRQGNTTVVVDIGGTTTDVGVLLPSGFPRQAAAFIDIGGVRTNFAMADVQSIGLGGGSCVRLADSGAVSVGPDSVGHNLTRDSKVFGGGVLTATDIVVASGAAELGDKARVADLDLSVVGKANGVIKKSLEGMIDRMKTSPDDVMVLLVGGGSVIAPDALAGVVAIVLSGEVDTIEFLQGRKADDVIEAIKVQAIEKAIKSGADPATTEVVEVVNIPVQYVTNQATRIIVRAAGELLANAGAPVAALDDTLDGTDREIRSETEEEKDTSCIWTGEVVDDEIDIESYRPNIRSDRAWCLSELDLEWIAEGCGVLGTGGGGSPYPPFLVARQLLREGKEIIVVDPDDVVEDAVFLRCMFMGSPSVSNERLQGGDEIPASAKALVQYMGLKSIKGTVSDEIGGGNGIQPMIVAAEMGNVVLGADLMGRAYPNMYQSLPGAFDIPGGLYPCAISDGIGNTVVLPTASSRYSVENILRTVTTEMGSRSGVAMAPLSRKTCQEYGKLLPPIINHSVSQAWRIGRAIALCRKRSNLKDVSSAVLELQNGACLFVGKIVNVQREVRKGFTWGSVTVAPLREDEEEDGAELQRATTSYGPQDCLVIPFQNENLYAYIEAPGQDKKILVTVPDLITVLDSQSGASLGTPDYRYGLRVTVIALAGHPKWTTTKEGLACGGLSAFGLENVSFTPIARYREPSSVIAQYAQ